MNNNDRVMIARLEERIKDMQCDISDIKTSMKSFNKCINSAELSIIKLDTSFANHLKTHATNIQISRKNWVIIGTLAGLISALISVASLVI
jgi:hypothetical protein